ncbi:MAG: alpha-galactosidase, partial [Clostridia bacterium]|nr:alpha-galactosidase [Clostridia bacterium]
RQHPDWALRVPGRKPAMSRDQLVLDLSRREVTDWLYATFSALLRENPIAYIKWDMNRGLSDRYSPALPPDRQGELEHRYALGLYSLLERLTAEFPQVLFEGCAGGGGRFDAGMLHYFPQIWLSDDTDAIERLDIQYGSSFAYPLSTISAHVSACPNHQTGRTVPLGTRTVVAMTGAFGYELDPATLSTEEKAQIRDHVQRYRSYRELIQTGLYYRLAHAGQNGWFTAWSSVSQDQSEALVSVVITRTRPNYTGVHFRLRGLDPSARYRLDAVHLEGVRGIVDSGHMETAGFEQVHFTGSTLLYAGYTLPQLGGDYPGVQLHFVREQN